MALQRGRSDRTVRRGNATGWKYPGTEPPGDLSLVYERGISVAPKGNQTVIKGDFPCIIRSGARTLFSRAIEATFPFQVKVGAGQLDELVLEIAGGARRRSTNSSIYPALYNLASILARPPP